MKKNNILTLLLILLASFTAGAITADKILANAAARFTKAGGISASYTFSSKTGGRSEGTIKVKGKKFRIDTPQVMVCYDGTNQWEYVKGNDECTLTAPTFQETSQLNPYAVLSTYKTAYRAASVKSSIKGTYAVRLTPVSSHSAIAKATLYVRASDWQPVRLDVLDRTGSLTTIIIKSITTGVNLPDATFRFDKTAHRGVEMIDLR